MTELGRWQFTIEAWVDRYATMLDELDRKVAAGQTELAGELAEAELLFGPGDLDDVARGGAEARRPRPAREDVAARSRSRSTSSGSAPASAAGTSSSRAPGAASRASSGRCPELAELGFDVLYLPPIHPIGTTNRKGRNNALVAAKGDPGSPWAIGGPEGGHDAIHPELGTLGDFDRLVEAARAHGLEIALDFAIQCSPDHPWLRGAPGVVQPPTRRDAQVRREPAQALPGHLQRQLRLGGLARALGGAARRRPPLVPARRACLPRRQPAHEVGAVLGVADRRGARGVPRHRSSSPRRSRGRR